MKNHSCTPCNVDRENLFNFPSPDRIMTVAGQPHSVIDTGADIIPPELFFHARFPSPPLLAVPVRA